MHTAYRSFSLLRLARVPVPRGLRASEEVVPKLGVKAGFPALRIGAVAKYDRPLEHLCGDLDGRRGRPLWDEAQRVPRRVRPPAPSGEGLATEPRSRAERWMGVRLLMLALVLAITACGGSPFASPTPSPQPLTVPQLKYRVIDEVGKPQFCDRDFYPIARQDEGEIAQQRFPELQRDTETFAVIVARLKLAAPYPADQQLAVYREWKTLEALPLGPVGPDVWGFDYLAQRAASIGEHVFGRVFADGKVVVLTRAAAGPPNCPICLALGTRIATPSGDVAVQDLRVGDVAWTIDARGARIAAPLIAIGSSAVPSTHEVVRLALEDGRLVFVSPGHPTADGRRVGDLAAGDTIDGARIASVERVVYTAGATYDILPAGATGNYWANGVLLGSTLR